MAFELWLVSEIIKYQSYHVHRFSNTLGLSSYAKYFFIDWLEQISLLIGYDFRKINLFNDITSRTISVN